MKKLLSLFLIIGMITSCSSDDDSGKDEITSAKIILNDANGQPVSGIVVYAYDEDTWEIIGDDPQFADFQAASNNAGEAVFTNLTSSTTFSELNNFSHTFRFSAHYSLGGVDKMKVKAITFSLGDDKTDHLILD